jgi:nucleotide-binding universal stress UspA family protein
MDNIKKILVPLDGSQCAEEVLPTVEKTAKGLGASIYLLRVAQTKTSLITNPTDAELDVVREAERYLYRLGDRLTSTGLKVECQVCYGNDAEEILKKAAEKDIGLIAMSSHGHGGVKRFLLGSVTEKIIHHSPKPVLLVRCRS